MAATPQSGVGGKFVADKVDSLLRGDYRHDMHLRRFAFCQQRLVGKFHRRSCCEHRVGDYQHLVVDAWSGDILDVDAEIVFAHIFAVGRHESVLSAVEIVVHTLMQRQSGAQDGGDNHSFVHHMAFCRSEASFGVDGLEFECL